MNRVAVEAEPEPTILEMKLKLHHHVAPLDRDVEEHVTVARRQRLEHSVLRAHDRHLPARLLERQYRVVVVDKRVEHLKYEGSVRN